VADEHSPFNRNFAAPGWFDDPTGAHELRYWDGDEWTEHVSDGGAPSRAPVHGAPLAPARIGRVPQSPSRSVFKVALVIAFALLLVGAPVVLAVVAARSGDSNETVVEPFDNPDAACEAWWRANVAAAREGWEDARLRSELRRLAEAAENIDAELATFLRNVASASDAAAVSDNSQAAYQRCVGLHRWRGATDEERATLANPSRPTR
jgi:Protein of unknown function (DUF2510)